jgi:dolichyl-phosphate beta-glucosyltransferase
MDADLSTPLPEIDAFLAFLETHPKTDIVVGNRQHPQSDIVKQQSWLRRSMGQFFNVVMRGVTGLRLRDTQCGFKAFRRLAREAIFPLQTLDGFAFDVELLLLAERLGFHVADLPVHWSDAEGSKVHLLRDSWRMLRDAFRVRRIVERTLRERAGDARFSKKISED